ncbi:hypothetical protein LIER_28715 [Lithospermum erythrorhizon]|uniref:Uncharacterized protein n=1 Tax=Lithospermum erythrorhizon TaxID=34254 RepID=A0AAV3RGN7_LITER
MATNNDVLADGGEEFMMESEVSRRMLASNVVIDYALRIDRAFCDADTYGSCNSNLKRLSKRPCTYQNHCKRG